MIKEKTNPIHCPRVSTPLFGCNIAWVQLGLWSVFGFQRRQHWCFELEYFCRGKLSCALYVGWLSPLLASLCSIPVDLSRCDNQKCLQTLPNAPPLTPAGGWGRGENPPGEKTWKRRASVGLMGLEPSTILLISCLWTSGLWLDLRCHLWASSAGFSTCTVQHTYHQDNPMKTPFSVFFEREFLFIIWK